MFSPYFVFLDRENGLQENMQIIIKFLGKKSMVLLDIEKFSKIYFLNIFQTT